MTDDPQRGAIPRRRLREDETTETRIRLDELRARQREHREDLARHDGKITTLQGQVERLDERVSHVSRIVWWGLGVVAALVVGGWGSVLAMLLGRK